jgi:hypothetical protein
MATNWSFGKEQVEIEEKTKELKDLLASNLDGQHNVAFILSRRPLINASFGKRYIGVRILELYDYLLVIKIQSTFTLVLLNESRKIQSIVS